MKEVKHMPASALRGVLHVIMEEQKDCSLTLNFSKGRLSGTLNIRERTDLNTDFGLTKAKTCALNDSVET